MSLKGIKVLDLTRVLAGPYCTMLLADLGCTVTKIERPFYGDETRAWGPPYVKGMKDNMTTYFASVNRNKRSACLDLSSPLTRPILHTLLRTHDVIIHNYLPQTESNLGLSYAQVRPLNPAIVHCSINGYGREGDYANKPGYDVLVSGMYGLTSITGPPADGGCGYKVGVAVTDVVTGTNAAFGVAGKLYEREFGGGGGSGWDGRVECSLMGSQLSMLSNVAGSELNSGERVPCRYGNAHESIVPYQTFECSDGGWIVVGTGNDAQWREFVDVAGIDVEGLERDTGLKFGSNADRVVNRGVLIPVIEEVIKGRRREEWVEAFKGRGFPNGPVRTVRSGLSCPNAVQNNSVVELFTGDDEGGGVKVVDHPVKHSGVTDRKGWRVPPRRGEHTREVLGEVGLGREDIEHLVREGVVECYE